MIFPNTQKAEFLVLLGPAEKEVADDHDDDDDDEKGPRIYNYIDYSDSPKN